MKNIAAWGIPALSLFLSGCVWEFFPSQDVRIDVTLNVKRVGALQKSSVITLNKLVFWLASSQGDTLWGDTLGPNSTPPLKPVSTENQSFDLSFQISPELGWTACAKTLDLLDSVIHMDCEEVPPLAVGQRVTISLDLFPRFTMYRAQFVGIPRTITFSSCASDDERFVFIHRLAMRVDSAAVADSAAVPYFPPGDTAALTYDYVPAGQRLLELLAYGSVDTPTGPVDLLFSGSRLINAEPGQDSSFSIQLHWVGPTCDGGAAATVFIARVGKVTLSAGVPGNVFE